MSYNKKIRGSLARPSLLAAAATAAARGAAPRCTMLQLIGSALVCHLAAAGPSQPNGVEKFSVTRLSPATYPGLLNMNSGDPRGDVAFGLWEVMFPEMCRGAMGQMMNIGCQNGTGKYIDPNAGNVTITYEKFQLEANTLFGESAAAARPPLAPSGRVVQ